MQDISNEDQHHLDQANEVLEKMACKNPAILLSEHRALDSIAAARTIVLHYGVRVEQAIEIPSVNTQVDIVDKVNANLIRQANEILERVAATDPSILLGEDQDPLVKLMIAREIAHRYEDKFEAIIARLPATAVDH